MLSLSNCFNQEELISFMNKIEKSITKLDTTNNSINTSTNSSNDNNIKNPSNIEINKIKIHQIDNNSSMKSPVDVISTDDLLPISKIEYILEPKIDGLSLALYYNATTGI